MSVLLQGFHPSFDSLSAYADLSDVDAARTRVGRHVARCASCAATVAEIRALGDAAREVELPGAPEGLWARIERASKGELMRDVSGAPAAERTDGRSGEREVATSVPSRTLPSLSRRSIIVLVAATLVLAVALLTPSGRGRQLHASPSTGRWRFTPERPTPGALVAVRYEPGPGMSLDSSFLLIGGGPHRFDDPAHSPIGGEALEDSLGVLTRQNDGSYAGRLVFPLGKRAMVVHLRTLAGEFPARVMSPSGPVTRAREPIALLVASDAAGRPSLEALSEASELWTYGQTVAFSVADTLIKYYPSEPIGYAVDGSAPRRLVDELIAYFKRGERQYTRFDDRLMREPVASAAHEIAMVIFANKIQEPGEARKWTMRLVREHPNDPRVLYIYSSMLSGMLGRPNRVDSVRSGLPLADTLWEANGGRGNAIEIAAVARTVGDTAASHRWMMRAVLFNARDYFGGYLGLADVPLSDPQIRSRVREVARRRVDSACRLPAGRYPLWSDVGTWTTRCARSRAQAYSLLSATTLTGGEASQALALADSSVALSDSLGDSCVSDGHRRRGEAWLALGDTARALPELAQGLGYPNWESNQRRDSIGAALRPNVSAERWQRETERAAADFTACVAAQRARRAKRPPS